MKSNVTSDVTSERTKNVKINLISNFTSDVKNKATSNLSVYVPNNMTSDVTSYMTSDETNNTKKCGHESNVM